MTTIACDGKTMACDGLVSDHRDVVVELDARKIFRLKDGRIVGGAGNRADVMAWIAWLETGKVGDVPIESDRFSAMILNVDGSILWVDHKGRELETSSPAAIGTGCEFALGAMFHGASPAQAVQAALRYDLFSGGSVWVEHI